MTALGKAIRNQYPPTTPVAVPQFDWDPNQHPEEHISAAVDPWMRHTGVNPKGDGTGMGQLFREAILKGVPFEVCQKMKSNPDLQGTDFTKWEKHLIHHLHTAQEAEKKKKKRRKISYRISSLNCSCRRPKTN
ncbi:hypothetical protein XENORESO_021093 [Xenotaenia resolanae]|uniref:Uncharacterized protein n=1 Tax=Xenotaenia resolanae TaxID=208358 RepID=A0ABV0WHH2_9TELE